MYFKVLLFLVVTVTTLLSVRSSKCPITCTKSACKENLKCSGSIVKGTCGCCDECAKVRGETCGGTFHVFGRCDIGLTCRKVQNQNYGYCVCKKAHHIADCPYGRARYANGCMKARCYDLPKCKAFSHHVGGNQTCPSVGTVFCDTECSNCCSHDTSCSPNDLQQKSNCKFGWWEY